MPAGRPTKYKPEFCDLVEGEGEDGNTLAAMAVACDVDRSTINDWMEKHPEFSRAVKRGLLKAQVWWEQKGKEGAMGGIDGFNATSFIFNMKNRFKDDWRDKHDFNHESEDGSMTPTVVERVIVKPDAD